MQTFANGRVFEDRSHVFHIRQRPVQFAALQIYNIGVRGKRGTAVQTYPAVQYDFSPSSLVATRGNLLHIQWTGSNTHNNGAPGGDGESGDAGEGLTGTDRHNFAQTLTADTDYPIPLDKFSADNFFSLNRCFDLDANPLATWTDCALILATSGQFRTVASVGPGFDPDMNTAPASLIGGVLVELQTAGIYHYMSTRSNHFAARSQKGVIVVT
jgi:hypothetical protein